jgi:hypothetical protein
LFGFDRLLTGEAESSFDRQMLASLHLLLLVKECSLTQIDLILWQHEVR